MPVSAGRMWKKLRSVGFSPNEYFIFTLILLHLFDLTIFEGIASLFKLLDPFLFVTIFVLKSYLV